MSNATHDPHASDGQEQRYAGWSKGMNNILADHEIPTDVLRAAVNVDVLDSGKIRRRKGTTQLSSTATHSLWTNGSIALCYASGALNRLNANDSLTSLASGLSGRPISFTEAGLDIYWSDGIQHGRISGGLALPWGVEVPGRPPSLSTGAGTLETGVYMAAITFTTATGEESAASLVNTASVTTGALTLTIPQPTESAVTHINVYLTQANGDVLYQIASIAVGVTTYAVITPPVFGQALRTQYLSRFLPCNIIEHWRGRIFGAIDNVLWCTEPYAYGLYRPSQNFYVFPSEIRLVIAVTGGLYVVCDKTYWLEGTGPGDFKESVVAPFSAARRSVTRVPFSTDVMWFSDLGLVIGNENGKIEQVQSSNVLPGSYAEGATVIREQNSISQAISIVRNLKEVSTLQADAPPANTLQDSTSSTLSATDWMEAELIPHA